MLKKFHGVCEFNITAVQARESTSCGQFCIFVAIHRYFNEDLPFQELLNDLFDLNLEKNEKRACDFIANLKNMRH